MKKKKKKKPYQKGKKKSRFSIFLKYAFYLFTLFVLFFFFFVFLVYSGVFGELPEKKALANIQNHTASEVYSSDEVLLGKYYIENRTNIANDNISPHVVHALIATEDKRFFEHEGLDYRSLVRVVLKSILLGNRREGGGSTISQQLAKNLFPRKYYGFMSLPVNKVREAIIASRLEKVYSKEEVLNLYLNTVPFGEDTYGIEAASQRFFSKSSARLDLKEAATLVGMLAAGSAYNPRLHPEKSKWRRNVVISRMVEQGYLENEEGEQLQATGLDIHYRRIDHHTGLAPYFREMIRLKTDKLLQDAYNGEYNLYTDGLKIYTSLHAKMQEYAEKAVKEHMLTLQKEFENGGLDKNVFKLHPELIQKGVRSSDRYIKLKKAGKTEEQIQQIFQKPLRMHVYTTGKKKERTLSPLDSVKYALQVLHTGFLAVDPHSGHILAWVGGVDHTYFQYDHVTARRQVGSTFKPFVYAAALEEGMDPCEYIPNEQKNYEEFDDWAPQNADTEEEYEGYYSLKGGLMYSKNTITAALMSKIGIAKVIQMAERFQISSKIPAVASIALGTAEIPLYEMVQAYTAFANEGIPVPLVDILRIEDAKGNILFEARKKESFPPVLEEKEFEVMREMLKAVVDSGTAQSLKPAFHLEGDIAGKTGTTQSNADGWFIGITPDIVAGCWVGAENPVVHFQSTAQGQGAHTALPIVGKFLQKVYNDRQINVKPSTFPPPSEEIKEILNCPAFVREIPDKGILESILDIFSRKTLQEKKLEREKRRKEKEKRKKGREKKGFFQRIKEAFQEEQDTTKKFNMEWEEEK